MTLETKDFTTVKGLAQLAKKIAQASKYASEQIVKDARHEYFNFDYLSLGALYSNLAPVLDEIGLAIVPSFEILTDEIVSKEKIGKQGGKFEVKLRRVVVRGNFTIIDTETGALIESSSNGESYDELDGATTKAITDCHKHFLCKLFLIGRDSDNKPSERDYNNQYNHVVSQTADQALQYTNNAQPNANNRNYEIVQTILKTIDTAETVDDLKTIYRTSKQSGFNEKQLILIESKCAERKKALGETKTDVYLSAFFSFKTTILNAATVALVDAKLNEARRSATAGEITNDELDELEAIGRNVKSNLRQS